MNILLVQQAVLDCFGRRMASDSGFVDGAYALLRSFRPESGSFSDLALRMEDYLFNALYDRLGSGMTLNPENGVRRRFLTSDIPALADRMLFPYFASLEQNDDHYQNLYAYWLRSGSVSAMRALLLRFSAYLPEQDRIWMERFAKENIPAEHQDSWFRLSE